MLNRFNQDYVYSKDDTRSDSDLTVCHRVDGSYQAGVPSFT